MSITALSAPDLFFDESYFWNHPQAQPSLLVQEPIDRLLEDEIEPALREVQQAYWEEAELRGL